MSDDREYYDNYEDQIVDTDEVVGTDIKINPDFYIHNALIKAQQALLNPDAKAGFMQFRMFIENIEILCRAAKMIPEDYEEKITEYKKTEAYTKADGAYIQSALLANKKLEILMAQVFSAKTNTQPMRA